MGFFSNFAVSDNNIFAGLFPQGMAAPSFGNQQLITNTQNPALRSLNTSAFHKYVVGATQSVPTLRTKQEVKPTPEGLPWKTVLPSDLTVIQSSTIGLLAEGLPCGCPTTVGGEVHLTAKIKSTNTLIGGPIPKTNIGDVEPIGTKP